jgi:hypothetical protein
MSYYRYVNFHIIEMCKVKVKVTPEQATKAQRESRDIALFFLYPLHWMALGGQRHALAALPPGKTRYPLYRRLCGPRGHSGRVRKGKQKYWETNLSHCHFVQHRSLM